MYLDKSNNKIFYFRTWLLVISPHNRLKRTQRTTHYPHLATHRPKHNKSYINFLLVIHMLVVIDGGVMGIWGFNILFCLLLYEWKIFS